MDESTAAATSTTTTTALTLELPTLNRQNSTTTSVAAPKKLALLASLLHRSSIQASPNQNQNSVTAPTKSLLDSDVVSLKSSSSYTSLKDVLSPTNAAINSPTASSAAIINSGYEMPIRNRLVKQAAWAYLQPMSASPSTPSGPHFLRRLWHRISSATRPNPLTACLGILYHQLVPASPEFFIAYSTPSGAK